MNDKKTIIAVVAVVAVVLAIVGSALVTGGKSDESANSTSETPVESSEQSLAQSEQSQLPETETPTAAPAANTTSVGITDYAFDPKTITVKVGDTVTWTNNDTARHDVTSDDGITNGPASELFGKGETYSFKFTKAGTYTYFCSPHPYMKGTVVVTE